MKTRLTNQHLTKGGAAVSERTAIVLLILAAAGFVALRVPCVAIPLERDEGEYAYIAQRMLAGDVPYRDAFDQKPPGVFFIYLLPVGLFGTSVTAIHVTAYLWTVATGLFMYLAARALAGPLAAAGAVLLLGVLTIEPTWLATAANTELFMLMPMAASLWCASRAVGWMDETRRVSKRTRLGWWFAAGAAAMTACWFKQVAATHAAFLAGFGVLCWLRERPRRPLTALGGDGLAFLSGVAAAMSPVLAYFAFSGGWSEFVDCVVTHNIRYAQTSTPSEGMEALKYQLEQQAGSLWMIWLLAITTIIDWRRGRRATAAVCLGWLAFSAAGVSIGWFLRSHYFIQLAPALALAGGVTLARVIEAAGRRLAGGGQAVLAAVVGVAAVAPGIWHHRDFYWRAASAAERSRMLYGGNPFVESQEIAEYLAVRSAPDETVLIFGSEPQILFFAQRRSATRYIFFYPLMMDPARSLPRQQEAWEEIRRAEPRFVIMTNLYTSLLELPEAPAFLREQVAGMLPRRYQIEGLRVFDGRDYRMVYGPPAAEHYRRALDRGRAEGLDMFIFRRR